MKILYRINQIVFFITVTLYLTIFLGMYAQFVLGIVQVLSAIIAFYFWGILSEKTQKHLTYYWIIIALYGAIWLIGVGDHMNVMVFLFGVPMVIATYFLYILSTSLES